jgi:hypothetical protein
MLTRTSTAHPPDILAITMIHGEFLFAREGGGAYAGQAPAPGVALLRQTPAQLAAAMLKQFVAAVAVASSGLPHICGVPVVVPVLQGPDVRGAVTSCGYAPQAFVPTQLLGSLPATRLSASSVTRPPGELKMPPPMSLAELRTTLLRLKIT